MVSGEFAWQCAYFSQEKYLRSVDNTAVSRDTITFDHTESGVGVFDADDGTWAGTGKTWILNEWADHYLSINDNYYKILSNTVGAPGVLTLDINSAETIADGAYNIYPFRPNSLTGLMIYPDSANLNKYVVIQSNTTTVLTMSASSLFIRNAEGTVTTGDAGAPYDTFRDSAFTGYADDHWNDFSIFFTSGDNAGESANIDDFTGSTGQFVLGAGLSNSIDVADEFIIENGLYWVSVGATFKIFSGYLPSSDDFEDIASALTHYRVLKTNEDGVLRDYNMPKPFIGRYAIEIFSEASKSFTAQLKHSSGAVRINLVNLSTNQIMRLLESSNVKYGSTPILFALSQRIWYRVEIYYYCNDKQNADIGVEGLKQFVYAWRDLTASAPTDIVITGADTNNDNDLDTMLPDSIEITWVNNVFLAGGGETEVWDSDTENGSYSIVTKVPATATKASALYGAGVAKWFKLRHISASGVEGIFSDPRKGVVSNTGIGNTQIELLWVDDSLTQVFPNENGWLNDTVLRGHVIVATDLNIENIHFWQQNEVAPEDLGVAYITYTGKSSGPFLLDEMVGEQVSGATGVVVADSNPAATGAGFLTLKTIAGTWTGGETILGQSAQCNGVDFSAEESVSSAIIAEMEVHNVYVKVDMTNGQDTGWVQFSFKYDKTPPDAPTISSVVARNMAFLVILGAYSYPSDFWRFEYHYDNDNSAPASDEDIMITGKDKRMGLSAGKAEIDFGATLYIWVRARDTAGNGSSWVSTSVAGDSHPMDGSFEVNDLMEFQS